MASGEGFLSGTEREIALNAFRWDEDSRKWGNLVLDAYDRLYAAYKELEIQAKRAGISVHQGPVVVANEELLEFPDTEQFLLYAEIEKLTEESAELLNRGVNERSIALSLLALLKQAKLDSLERKLHAN